MKTSSLPIRRLFPDPSPLYGDGGDDGLPRNGPSGRHGAEAIDRLRQGDAAVWEETVRVHAGRMLGVARRLLRNEDDAIDALQEAFLQAFRSVDRFRGDCLLSTWLHRIVVNACLAKLRRASRSREKGIEDLLPAFAEDGHRARPVEPWTPAVDDVEREEVRARVRALIARLPLGHRAVLILRDIEELPTGETASILRISENAVKVRLHRARLALQGLLEREFAGGVV